MPGFDRTGPLGAGPTTGGGRGFCGSRAGVGRRFGGGFFRGAGRGGWWGASPGWGRGFSRGAPYWGAPPARDEETDALKAELASARDEIAALEARLAELEKET